MQQNVIHEDLQLPFHQSTTWCHCTALQGTSLLAALQTAKTLIIKLVSAGSEPSRTSFLLSMRLREYATYKLGKTCLLKALGLSLARLMVTAMGCLP